MIRRLRPRGATSNWRKVEGVGDDITDGEVFENFNSGSSSGAGYVVMFSELESVGGGSFWPFSADDGYKACCANPT